jgi:stress response protein YsnF
LFEDDATTERAPALLPFPIEARRLCRAELRARHHETAEHALVSKSARVVEEVELSKIGSDHVETVHEKLRRQQVEIERVGADGKRIARA